MKQRVCRRLFCMLMTLVALFSTAVHAAGQGIYEKESYAESVTAFAMKKNTQATYDTSLPFAETVSAGKLSAEALDGMMLCAGGMPFGVKFYTDGVTVVGFCDVESKSGRVNPAAIAGLKQKDVIVRVNYFVISFFAAEQLDSAVRDDLVGIHICRRTRAALNSIYYKVIKQPSAEDLIASQNNGICDTSVQNSRLTVSNSRRFFDLYDRADNLRMHSSARNFEIF